jgi:hypothetical protein
MLCALLGALALAGCGGNDWDDPWQDAAGDEVAEPIISTGTGCPNDDAVLLHLGWPPGTAQLRGLARQYVRDPSGKIVTGSGSFDASAKLPDSARSSGYRRGEAELWVGQDAAEFVYLVFDDHAERWPRMVEPVGCA